MLNPNDAAPPAELRPEDADFLPYNYLPAALPDLMGQGSGQNRILLILPDAGDLSRMDHAVIPSEVLGDPAATARFVRQLVEGRASEIDQQRIFLGPPTSGSATGRQTTLIPPVDAEANSDFDRAVLVIDAGIAFWHPRFRGLSGPRFREVRFLDFDGQHPETLTPLDRAEIARLCHLADSAGPQAVRAELGARFPSSFHGEAASTDPDGLWHGTAVADLAAGDEVGRSDHVALFGLELPMAVVQDSDGDSLTAMLAVALGLAVQMATSLPQGVSLTVVLPYGFTGGPQDGQHPAARTIDEILTQAASSAIQVVLPAGNHRQDRARAALGQDGGPVGVDWWVAPDDYSVNLIEAVAPLAGAGGTLALDLTSPMGTLTPLRLSSAGHMVLVTQDGVRIGAALRFRDLAGWSRLRLALARTAVERATDRPVPHGRWRLSSPDGRPLDLWLLRDDRDRVADRAWPRRPSWFSDDAYRAVDDQGAACMTDDAGSAVRRSGTLSVLATAKAPDVVVVAAEQRLGDRQQAGWYSGLGMAAEPGASALVDDGWISAGRMVAANGGMRRMRMSGTSAAAGLQARALAMGLPAPDA